jgi:hypothetical protein
LKLLGFFFHITPNIYAGIAVANKNTDVPIFSKSVNALAIISITNIAMNNIGIGNGIFIGRSRSGCL